MSDIPYAAEGEWIRVPDSMLQKIVCCDCGLTHRMEFRTRKGKVEWRSFRDEEKTKEVREKDKSQAQYIDQRTNSDIEEQEEYEEKLLS